MQHRAISIVNNRYLKQNLPIIKSGDDVKVSVVILEGKKERLQLFEGKIIKIQGASLNQTVTVRKDSFGVGVERVFPIHSPLVANIEVLNHNRTRRARLYFLRQLTGKRARLTKIRLTK